MNREIKNTNNQASSYETQQLKLELILSKFSNSIHRMNKSPLFNQTIHSLIDLDVANDNIYKLIDQLIIIADNNIEELVKIKSKEESDFSLDFPENRKIIVESKNNTKVNFIQNEKTDVVVLKGVSSHVNVTTMQQTKEHNGTEVLFIMSGPLSVSSKLKEQIVSLIQSEIND